MDYIHLWAVSCPCKHYCGAIVYQCLFFFVSFFSQFGFRKWKGNVTEKPIEDRSEIIQELYSDLSVVKPQEGLSHSFLSR